MDIAIIEINDIGVRCFHGETRVVSPGYALLGKDGVITGEAAMRRRYLEPQRAFNQYWRQLNLSSLQISSRFARHHADLAYAQLLQLHGEAGSPEEVIFAVPGSFTDDQLSVLLGLGNALPFDVVGLVDSAVADCAGVSGELLHVDVQLHQTVLTRLQTAEQLARTGVEVLADVGLSACYESWAHHIADQFIRQYRYDPLHTAAGEQQLHDKLPNWVEQLQHASELPIELDTAKGALRLNLSRSDIKRAGESQQKPLASALQRLAGESTRVIFSHRINQLLGNGLLLNGGGATTLTESGLASNCLANIDAIRSTEGDINFVTRLPLTEKPVAVDASDERAPANGAASHVLVGDVAYRIGERLALAVTPEGIKPAAETTADNHRLLLLKNGGRIVLKAAQTDIESPAALHDLKPGDNINISGFQLRLIEER